MGSDRNPCHSEILSGSVPLTRYLHADTFDKYIDNLIEFLEICMVFQFDLSFINRYFKKITLIKRSCYYLLMVPAFSIRGFIILYFTNSELLNFEMRVPELFGPKFQASGQTNMNRMLNISSLPFSGDQNACYYIILR